MDQPARLVDGPLEDRIEVGGTADPRRDLAQAALDLGALGELAARPIEVGDEPDVGHRRGRVIGERADKRDLGGVERAGARREGAERTEHLVSADERCNHHRTDPDVLHDAIRIRGMGKRVVVDVVVGDHDRSIRNRAAHHASADGEPDPAQPTAGPFVVNPGVEAETQDLRLRVQQVDHRAVGVEQAGGFLDGALQQRLNGRSVPVRPDLVRVDFGQGRGDGCALPGWHVRRIRRIAPIGDCHPASLPTSSVQRRHGRASGRLASTRRVAGDDPCRTP